MQVCSDMEDIVHSVTSSLGLQNCAVAIYNIENKLLKKSKPSALPVVPCTAMCSW